jgi:hypothetical protein
MSAEPQRTPTPIARPDDEFWNPPHKSIEELAAEQGVEPWTAESIAEMHRIGKEIWPEDDIEEFLAWLREIRGKAPPSKEH